MVIHEEDELKAYTDLFIHWDSTFWSAFYYFLVLQGALILAFTTIYTGQFVISEIGRKIILLFVSFGGTILSFAWLFVLNRKMTYTLGAQDNLKKYIGEVWLAAEKKQEGLACFRSRIIVHTILPSIFAIVWIISTIIYLIQIIN